jgi:hypothetical protein
MTGSRILLTVGISASILFLTPEYFSKGFAFPESRVKDRCSSESYPSVSLYNIDGDRFHDYRLISSETIRNNTTYIIGMPCTSELLTVHRINSGAAILEYSIEEEFHPDGTPVYKNYGSWRLDGENIRFQFSDNTIYIPAIY